MKLIKVEKYNPEWKKEFEKAKFFYKELLKDIDPKIVHVGSTSVKGMWAKPILDIDIIVSNTLGSNKVIKLLEGVGYTHIGNMGVKGREAFKYSNDNQNIKWMKHNLYVCISGNENLKNHLLLKKHLQNNKDALEEYSKLKYELAKKYPDDINSYVDGKTELITGFLKAEGMDLKKLNRIKSINKKN